MTSGIAPDPDSAPELSGDAAAASGGLRVYGGLVRRLESTWHLLRDCRLAIDDETYEIQLVLVHRDYGIGLIAFRDEHYTYPELAIRLARRVLRDHGLHALFPGFVPIVFIAADPRQGRDLPARIAGAFAAERKLDMIDPAWAEWASRVLGREAAATGRGGGESAASPASGAARERAPRRRVRILTGLLTAAMLLVLIGDLLVGRAILMPSSRAGGGSDPSPARSAAQSPALSAAAPDRAPRLLGEAAAARYLGLDLMTFRARRALLERSGFPAAEPITGGYDRDEIDRWIDAKTRGRLDSGADATR